MIRHRCISLKAFLTNWLSVNWLGDHNAPKRSLPRCTHACPVALALDREALSSGGKDVKVDRQRRAWGINVHLAITTPVFLLNILDGDVRFGVSEVESPKNSMLAQSAQVPP